jgi:hypothetical protein
MSSQNQYVTITHYKEREFYFLNYAIQTNDGVIPKEIEQFHESDKAKFIERIRMLQSQYPNNHIASISLEANQSVSQDDDRNRATAVIFKDNFVTQDNIDVGDIPTTLYFSPFSILYQQYKNDLSDKLTLIIGLFDRKLFMMFATDDKIHQSWTIGTRGLTEKQVAERVYKSMQAYYKISYSFADHIEMLVSDESPKLLKVLREELSLHIELHQNSIHNLLHTMASSQEIAKSSYIKSFKKIEVAQRFVNNNVSNVNSENQNKSAQELKNIKKEEESKGFLSSFKSIFSSSEDKNMGSSNSLLAIVPLFVILAIGTFFSLKNGTISNKISQKNLQISSHEQNLALVSTSENLFKAMGKNAELKEGTISTKRIDIRGVVWGIEPLKKSLKGLYSDGKFVIKPLENFMTEFSFTTK